MNEQSDLLREIRDLLILLAEPAIAQRDEKRRNLLRQVVGKSASKIRAVSLMDGSRNQAEIKQLAKVDAGDLSRLVKALRAGSLLMSDERPRLSISLPATFFDTEDVL